MNKNLIRCKSKKSNKLCYDISVFGIMDGILNGNGKVANSPIVYRVLIITDKPKLVSNVGESKGAA